MRIETIEIYSDVTSAVVIRHPARKFPGVLIQGDTLHSLGRLAEVALARAEPESDQWYDLKHLLEVLQRQVDSYVQVMRDHGLELPFVD